LIADYNQNVHMPENVPLGDTKKRDNSLCKASAQKNTNAKEKNLYRKKKHEQICTFYNCYKVSWS